jgi:squalene cyclase
MAISRYIFCVLRAASMVKSYLPRVSLLSGWATYENNRGFGWYEALNPSEAFGDIMIDYSYVECSMACLTALYDFHQRYPNTRSREVSHALDTGRAFLKSIQREVSQTSKFNSSPELQKYV